MPLRVDAVEIRLLRLEAVISELTRLAGTDPDLLRANLSEMWGVERGLQLGAEILLDIGNHILVAEYGVSSQEYRDIFKRLAERKVISRSLAERLGGLRGSATSSSTITWTSTLNGSSRISVERRKTSANSRARSGTGLGGPGPGPEIPLPARLTVLAHLLEHQTPLARGNGYDGAIEMGPSPLL